MSQEIQKVSETHDFSALEKELAHYARAIGHPARIAVILAILRRGNKVQGEIIELPAISRATVQQHLRELKRAGIIQGRIFGAKAEYSIDKEALKKFAASFTSFMEESKEADN